MIYKDIVILPVDKGGAPIVMKVTLSDKQAYAWIQEDPTKKRIITLSITIQKFATSGRITRKGIWPA